LRFRLLYINWYENITKSICILTNKGTYGGLKVDKKNLVGVIVYDETAISLISEIVINNYGETDYIFISTVPSNRILKSILELKKGISYLINCIGIKDSLDRYYNLNDKLCESLILNFASENGYAVPQIINPAVTRHSYIDDVNIKNILKLTENSIIKFIIDNANIQTEFMKVKVFQTILIDFDYENNYAVLAYKALVNSNIISGEVLLYKQNTEWYCINISVTSIEACTNDDQLYNLDIQSIPIKKNRITLSMVVKNEAARSLKNVLEHAVQYIDSAVIIDDCSTDETVNLCSSILKNTQFYIVHNNETKFKNEVNLRRQQWEYTISTNPDWIINLDADEIFENKMVTKIKELVDIPYFYYYTSHLYDFWNSTHYREDQYWNAHFYHKIFLVRFVPEYKYTWQNTPQHCGRIPNNITELRGLYTDMRLKHFGWADEESRVKKYKRYMELDPNGVYGNIEQYNSILDPNPTLVRWIE
jgi:hypothetical protein